MKDLNYGMSPLECVLINESWENALDILNTCNCCERHKIDRPTKDKKWYDRGLPNRNLNRNQVWYRKDWRMYIKYCMPCNCTCRYLAREITRVFRKYKNEKCPVREELYSKFGKIIDNATECSICLSDIDNLCVTTLNFCGHTFCKKCITKWFGNKQLIECPICRVTCWSDTLHNGTWNQRCKVYL